jgi:hypothetical protein
VRDAEQRRSGVLRGYLNQNLTATFEALPQLGARHAYAVLRNSLEASFAAPAAIAGWVAGLDREFARAASGA